MNIRPAAIADHPAIWAILEPVIRAGETYALPRDMTVGQGLGYWFAPHHQVFVAVVEAVILGTYFLCPNQQGGGAHVANCGYVTGSHATGQGIGRAMCAHSLSVARAQNFRAMQFNFVVSTNARAIKLWESFGFQTIGVLPKAFDHPYKGDIDALVMFQSLI